jgi:hypothetical protein
MPTSHQTSGKDFVCSRQKKRRYFCQQTRRCRSANLVIYTRKLLLRAPLQDLETNHPGASSKPRWCADEIRAASSLYSLLASVWSCVDVVRNWWHLFRYRDALVPSKTYRRVMYENALIFLVLMPYPGTMRWLPVQAWLISALSTFV